MKKTSKLFILAAMAAVVFSCSKEKQFDSDINVQEGNNPGKAVVPAVDGNRLTSFKYTLENPGTKVDVNLVSGLTNIEDGDKVLVFVGEGNKSVYEYDLVNNKFVLHSGDGVVLSSPASVFYPADEFAADGANVKFTMPAAIEASGDLGAINPMAGIIEGTSGSYTVELKNVASVLRVKVIADENITSVKLDYGTDVKYASGSKFIVDASAITMAATDASSNTYETCSIATPAKSADVLFMVPTISLTNGLTITANLDGAASSRSISRTAYTPLRNKISKLDFRAFFSGGLGTEDNPYKIADARDFKNIQTLIANGFDSDLKSEHFQTAYYKQTANIDINNEDLTPIGNETTPFAGFYDGDGNSLQNIAINASADNAGVFGYMTGGTVKKLNVSGNISSTANQVGGIVGYMAGGTIEECSFIGDVTGNAQVGGIVGDAGLQSSLSASNICKITACRVNADVESVLNGASNVGGLLGRIRHSVIVNSCYAKGTVKGAGYNIGGLVGQMVVNVANVVGRSYMFDCLANMNVTATRPAGQNVRLGGAVGYILNSTDNTTANAPYVGVDNCVVAPVTITASGNNVGGFVGALKGNTADTATDMKNRLRLRNNCTFVSSVPGGNGFMGTREDGQMTLQFNYCAMSTDAFFEGSVPAGVTRQNCGRSRTYASKAAELCTAFNSNTGYSLTINSVTYTSGLGWTAPDGVEYIVPGALTNLGEEYYK